MMRRIHCLNNISKVGLNVLPDHYEVTDDLKIADAILVRSAKMHDMALPDSILAVARAGAGVNNIPLDQLKEQGIVVFNTPGANANAVKELTLAGLLMAVRNVYEGMRWIDSNRTDPDLEKSIEKAKKAYAGSEISGKTIGIIGLGQIGLKLADACLSLGMDVIGYDAFPARLDQSQFPQGLRVAATLEELFKASRFISLNLPLNEHTKHTIDQTAFDRMNEGTILLNFARGGLVDDDALARAIEAKRIYRYVTDFPNPKTANMEGVLAIPHLGASSKEAEDNCAEMAAHQIVQYIDYGNIRNSVNFPDLDGGKPQDHKRVTVLYRTGSNVFAKVLEEIEKNTETMQVINKEKGDVGYCLFDTTDTLGHMLIQTIASFEGVIRIRKITS
jgi:D-3-phosphoglycerate dehydrogenase / 2-oxoglutarate reductase